MDASKFDILYYINIFSVALDKFRCINTSSNVWDYANLGSFNRFQIKLIVEEISFNLLSLPFSKMVI